MDKPLIHPQVHPRVHHLTLPLTAAKVRELACGDIVHLHGDVVLGAGLQTHERVIECLDGKREFPLPMRGGTFFHLPTYSREVDGRDDVAYINPTTSTRFNEFMPRIIRELDIRLTGGKGGLDAESARAMQDTGCAYLSFIGGGLSLFTEAIREVKAVHWKDLYFHYRLVQLRVEALGPATVGIDAHGRSLFSSITEEARGRIPDILKGLGPRKAT